MKQQELDQNSGQTPGIPTGYRDLDQMTPDLIEMT